MTDSKLIADKLWQSHAIHLNLASPYTWASGWKSPIYCDNRRALSFPYTRDFIKSELCDVIFRQFSDAALIAGVATAGIAWGALVADQLKLPFIYVRPKPKEHGLGNQIEGYFEKGQKTVVVEDLVSTGKSSLEVVDAIKAAGLPVDGMVSIFNYGFSIAADAIKKSGLRYFTLTDYASLIALASERKQFSQEELAILLKWREDPANWKGVY